MYYDKGIKNYWLDGCEPEIYPFDMDNLLFSLGDGKAVANLYPLCHQRGIAEALYAEGERDFVLLCRSGWLGTQRFGSALWSGDILSNWQTFADQIHVGLHVGMSGIPWWTSDIGGFMEGNIHDEGFQELLIRWFEYGIFCPLCRLHGNRDPRPENPTESGADNEVWSFGDKAYGILQKMLRIRETLRPYIYREMERTSQDGLPMMRPLFSIIRRIRRAGISGTNTYSAPRSLLRPYMKRVLSAEVSIYPKIGNGWMRGQEPCMKVGFIFRFLRH